MKKVECKLINVQNFRQLTCLILTISILATFISCEKVEGPGGKATITGKLKQFDIDIEENGDTIFEAEYYVPNENVFIIYGKNGVFDDDIKTNFDGTFNFSYLRKGSYTLFAYTECDKPEDICPIFKEVEVNRGDKIIDIGEIVVYNK